MRVKIAGELDLPDVISSLLLGIPVNSQTSNFRGVELTLDEEALVRLSSILHIIYPDEDGVNKWLTQPQTVVQQSQYQPQPQPQIVYVEKPVQPIQQPVVEQPVQRQILEARESDEQVEKKKISELKRKSKGFIK